MKLLAGIILFVNALPIGQKFMVKGSDTLPYKMTAEVQKDTLTLGKTTYYPGDTMYGVPCNTFEKVNGQIINVTDESCQSQGLWIIKDSTGAYRTGMFKNDNETGVWKYYDKKGNLVEETESVTVAKDTYLVKDIVYTNGVPKVVVNKPIFGFFMKIIWIYFIVLMLAFFIRVFINSQIYNLENGTDFSPIYIQLGFITNFKRFEHSVQCVFSFWFSNYKPENRKRVLISNTLSVISLVMFFGLLIGFIIGGEIK